jgi:hypothetical protein
LGILKLPSDVSVPIPVKLDSSIVFHRVHLYVDLRQCLVCSPALDSQFTVPFKDRDLECRAVEILELLLICSIDLNHNVLVREACWHRYRSHNIRLHKSLLGSTFNRLNVCQKRLHVTELFSIILQEGCSREEDLCIDRVVLDHALGQVDCLDRESAFFVNSNVGQVRFLSFAFSLVTLLLLSKE